jgi:hypothetical protein
MAPAKRFSEAVVFLLQFWASLLTVFNSFFYHLAAFVLQKQTLLAARKHTYAI